MFWPTWRDRAGHTTGRMAHFIVQFAATAVWGALTYWFTGKSPRIYCYYFPRTGARPGKAIPSEWRSQATGDWIEFGLDCEQPATRSIRCLSLATGAR
jgi:hypothetical protein